MPPGMFLAFVRQQLPPLGLDPGREAEIVEELAQQLERTYDAARAGWASLAREVVDAERSKAEQAARRVARPVLVEPESGLVGAVLQQTWQDARYGLRWLGASPGSRPPRCSR